MGKIKGYMQSKRRPFWQFHLLTNVAVTICVGGLIGLNMIPHREPLCSSNGHRGYGWPALFCVDPTVVNSFPEWQFVPTTFAIDVAYWLVAGGVLVLVSEWSCRTEHRPALLKLHLLTYVILVTIVGSIYWLVKNQSLDHFRLASVVTTGAIVLSIIGAACEWMLRRRP